MTSNIEDSYILKIYFDTTVITQKVTIDKYKKKIK